VRAPEAPPGPEHERCFALFGSQVRLLVGAAVSPGLPPPALAAQLAEAVLRRFQDCLTRFEPESELGRVNADPREVVPVSPLLASALSAGLRAAELSGGLVDPTLTGALERAGYGSSLAGAVPAPLAEAVHAAPARAPARPRADASWRAVSVEDGRVARPPGTRFDLGGTAKGLAADTCARQLSAYATFAVDAGGDVRVGGARPVQRMVEVDHPLRGGRAHRFLLATGAVATSGLGTRIWRRAQGFGHHLLDPATGEPAWTGVIQATALAPTALEAEALAKVALLSGPEPALRVLAGHGGVLVLDDGRVLLAGDAERAEAA
jgi:thiamine biosynthesis lipoprotein